MDSEWVFLRCRRAHTWIQRLETVRDPQGLSVFVFLHLIEHCPECGQRYQELWTV